MTSITFNLSNEDKEFIKKFGEIYSDGDEFPDFVDKLVADTTTPLQRTFIKTVISNVFGAIATQRDSRATATRSVSLATDLVGKCQTLTRFRFNMFPPSLPDTAPVVEHVTKTKQTIAWLNSILTRIDDITSGRKHISSEQVASLKELQCALQTIGTPIRGLISTTTNLLADHSGSPSINGTPELHYGRELSSMYADKLASFVVYQFLDHFKLIEENRKMKRTPGIFDNLKLTENPTVLNETHPIIEQPTDCVTELFLYQKIAVRALLTIEENIYNSRIGRTYVLENSIKSSNLGQMQTNSVTFMPEVVVGPLVPRMHLCIPPGRGKTLIALALIMEAKKLPEITSCAKLDFPPFTRTYRRRITASESTDLAPYTAYIANHRSKPLPTKTANGWQLPNLAQYLVDESTDSFQRFRLSINEPYDARNYPLENELPNGDKLATTLVLVPSMLVAVQWQEQAKKHYPSCKLLLIERPMTSNRLLRENKFTPEYLGSFDVVVVNVAKYTCSETMSILRHVLWKRVVCDDLANDTFRQTHLATFSFMDLPFGKTYLWISATESVLNSERCDQFSGKTGKKLLQDLTPGHLKELVTNLSECRNLVTVHGSLLTSLDATVDIVRYMCHNIVKMSSIHEVLIAADTPVTVIEQYKLGIVPAGIGSTKDLLEFHQFNALKALGVCTKEIKRKLVNLTQNDANKLLAHFSEIQKKLMDVDNWPAVVDLPISPASRATTLHSQLDTYLGMIAYYSTGTDNHPIKPPALLPRTDPNVDRAVKCFITKFRDTEKCSEIEDSILKTITLSLTTHPFATNKQCPCDHPAIAAAVARFGAPIVIALWTISAFVWECTIWQRDMLSAEHLEKIVLEIKPTVVKQSELHIMTSTRINVALQTDCPICMTTFDKYHLFAKCSHIVCDDCGNQLRDMSTNKDSITCPLCRQKGVIAGGCRERPQVNPVATVSKESAYLNLIQELQSDVSKRILVFIDRAVVESAGYIFVPGHLAAVNTENIKSAVVFNRFKQGLLPQDRLLILESSKSAGIEMTYVTDIIFPCQLSRQDTVQALGRVIRTGRVSTLKVHSLLFDDEVELDINDILKTTVRTVQSDAVRTDSFYEKCVTCNLLKVRYPAAAPLTRAQILPHDPVYASLCKCNILNTEQKILHLRASIYANQSRQPGSEFQFGDAYTYTWW